MKVCHFCGAKNEDWMAICQECGNPIIDDGTYDNKSDNDTDYKEENSKVVKNTGLKITIAVLLIILIALSIYTFYVVTSSDEDNVKAEDNNNVVENNNIEDNNVDEGNDVTEENNNEIAE